MDPILSFLLFLLSLFALLFGIWTIIGLLKRASRPSANRLKKRKWILGVCADFSYYVGIPLWIVRLYALVYGPLLLGFIFYLLYYWVMRLRKKTRPPVTSKPPATVTKMDIHRY